MIFAFHIDTGNPGRPVCVVAQGVREQYLYLTIDETEEAIRQLRDALAEARRVGGQTRPPGTPEAPAARPPAMPLPKRGQVPRPDLFGGRRR